MSPSTRLGNRTIGVQMRSDVAIAGGGPAGSVAALLLARAGLAVTLVTLPEGPERIEGLSPRVAQILERLEIAAPAGAAIPRVSRWGALSGALNREHPVERAAFDRALRAAAEAAGARVVAARAGRLDPVRREIATEAGPVSAGALIEARGRRAPAEAGGLGGRLRGPATVAISGFAGPAETEARVAARPAGWIWRAPWRGRTWMQAVTDAALARDRGVAGAWAALAGATPLPEAPLVRAAELRLGAAPPAGVVVLGDAAAAMDPLSGHGMFWALSSALAAPPQVRAILEGEAALAARFQAERMRATFWRQARIGRDFHRAAGQDGPFWAARAAWPDAAPAHATIDRPALRRGIVVAEGRLTEAEVLVTPQDPEGVAFVAGVALGPALARLGAGPLPPLDVFRARIAPEADPAAAAALHGFLCARGLAARPPLSPQPPFSPEEVSS